jgi:16S rRNA (cytidine1402-2'-O)-methyltransferase
MKGPESGTLFVVATPIGNLEDITLRALRVFREVAVVAAEDTRRSGNLLRHYDIRTPLVSLHEHNEHRRRIQLVARLKAGESIALVTDAGTPAISDPGASFVRAAREAGIRVEPVPGPSAVTAALSVTGVEAEGFVFVGFLSTRSSDRKLALAILEQLPALTFVCFEAPHRLRRTLRDLGLILGGQPIFLAREVTKIHEEWLEGPPAKIEQAVGEPRGEFVILVPPRSDGSATASKLSDQEVRRVFGQITEIGAGGRRAGIRELARRTGRSQKEIYAALERTKDSGK